MTETEQNIAVAVSVGIPKEDHKLWKIPDFTGFTDAIQSAIQTLSDVRTLNSDGQLMSERDEFLLALERIIYRDTGITNCRIQFELVTASPAQLTEAYLRARKLWRESK